MTRERGQRTTPRGARVRLREDGREAVSPQSAAVVRRSEAREDRSSLLSTFGIVSRRYVGRCSAPRF